MARKKLVHVTNAKFIKNNKEKKILDSHFSFIQKLSLITYKLLN